MDHVLYEMMDWAAVEEIVYSEAANPDLQLGPHLTERGLLIQAFIPNAGQRYQSGWILHRRYILWIRRTKPDTSQS